MNKEITEAMNLLLTRFEFDKVKKLYDAMKVYYENV